MFEAEGTAAQREADYYELFTDWRRDIDFFTALAQQIGGPILELGCGTGRITLPIARAGIDIDGIDIAAERLRIAHEACGQLPREARVRFFPADIRKFSLDHTYRLVLFPYRVLQELTTTTDKIDCLRCVHDHLDRGGFVLIDNYCPSVHYLATDPTLCTTESEKQGPGGERIRRTQRVIFRDYANQTQQPEVVYDITHPDGTTEHLVIPYRTSYLFRFELEHLLARCGFTVAETWGGYERQDFGNDSPGELIVLAQRADRPA
ncbi:class I SAM-dependent methyltransferase [Nocardia wallacei]|uniref:class I SAM-dependent methyltransferase n=1 Tax=Nocardia wallacei TaxID=480035 RepID=UPI0024537CF9|nr:class I SAM-dependent methyltransferase [Nocardia wallacei]